jgi:hypothetical protein
MRLKSVLGTLIVASLVASVVPSYSAPAPKAGAVCKKAGISQSYNGKVFTCKKSGKKLVWGKGELVKQAAPIPAPTPSPITTLTPKPSPSPTPTPSGPAAPITFDNLDLKWTTVVARQDLLAEFARLSQPKSTANFRIAPNVREDLVAEEKRLLAVAERMFSGYFLPASFEVILFSEKDGEWADKEKEPLVGPRDWSIARDIANNPFGCNFAGATKTVSNVPMYNMCLDSKGRSIEDKQTSIHEYFHLVQQKYELEKMTCWLVECSATYFGIALGVDGSDPTGASSLKFLNGLANQYNPGGTGTRGSAAMLRNKLATDSGAVEVMQALEKRPGDCLPLGAYTLGAIATEALIAVKGYKTYMDFVSTFASSTDWKAEFKKFYEITPDEFYLKLAPYLRGRLGG